MQNAKYAAHHILKTSYYPNKTYRSETHLWFLEFLKVKWEAAPSALKALSYGTSSKLGFGTETPSL